MIRRLLDVIEGMALNDYSELLFNACSTITKSTSNPLKILNS